MTHYVSSLQGQLGDIEAEIESILGKTPNNWLAYTKGWDLQQILPNTYNLPREALEFLEIENQFSILSYDNILQFDRTKLNKTKFLKDVKISSADVLIHKANVYYSCPKYMYDLKENNYDYKLFVASLLRGLRVISADGTLVCKLPHTQNSALVFSAVFVCSKMFSEEVIIYRPLMSSPHANTAYVIFNGYTKLTEHGEIQLKKLSEIPESLEINENIVDYCEDYLSSEIRRLKTMVSEFKVGTQYPMMKKNRKKGMSMWNIVSKNM